MTPFSRALFIAAASARARPRTQHEGVRQRLAFDDAGVLYYEAHAALVRGQIA